MAIHFRGHGFRIALENACLTLLGGGPYWGVWTGVGDVFSLDTTCLYPCWLLFQLILMQNQEKFFKGLISYMWIGLYNLILLFSTAPMIWVKIEEISRTYSGSDYTYLICTDREFWLKKLQKNKMNSMSKKIWLDVKIVKIKHWYFSTH